MRNNSSRVRGLVYAFITAIISGVAIFYSKISLANIDPLTLTTVRNLFVGAVFLFGVVGFRKFDELKKIGRKDLIILSVIGVIGGGVPFYLFFTGLQSIGAQSANMIHKSLFVWVSLFAVISLHEQLPKKSVLAFVLVFAGTFLFTPVKFIVNTGTFMVLAATILWSAETVISKKILTRFSPEIIGLSRMLIGGAVLLGISMLTDKTLPIVSLDVSQLQTILVGGSLLFGYVYFWYKSLKLIPAHVATLALSISVIVGTFLNGSFASIAVTSSEVFASLLIAGGIILLYATQLKISIQKSH